MDQRVSGGFKTRVGRFLRRQAVPALATALIGVATTACRKEQATGQPAPEAPPDIHAAPDCAKVRACALETLPHAFFPTTRIDWAERARHCLGPPELQDRAARECLPVVFARDIRNDREVGLCTSPIELPYGTILVIGYPEVGYAECACLGRALTGSGTVCLPTTAPSRLTEDALQVTDYGAPGHPMYELKMSRDFPLAGLLALPDTSILAVRGRPVRAASELKRRFLDLIDNPPGRVDFATGTPQIKSHEVYLIDRIHVDRLASKMTELMMDGLLGLAPCGTAMYPTDPEYITLTADKSYTIDSDCKDDRTHKLLEFVREMEIVAADAEKAEKRRVPPATCAEMRTLFTHWSLVSKKRIIDLRYVDWTPASQ